MAPVAKQTTRCERCDGTFDGTPSGWAKHADTDKHNRANPIPGDGRPDSIKLPDLETRAQLPYEDHLPDEGSVVFPPTEPVETPEPLEAEDEPDELEFDLPDPTELDERPESLLFAEFRPYDYPGRPEAVQELRTRTEGAVLLAEQGVAKYKRYVRHGELHNLKLLPKYQQQLAEAQDLLAKLKAVEEGIDAYDRLRLDAHYDRVQEYWTEVHHEVLRQLGKVAYNGPRLEGASFALPIIGGWVEVNGPRAHFGDEGEREIQPASVTAVNIPANMDPELAQGIGQSIEKAGLYAAKFNEVIGL